MIGAWSYNSVCGLGQDNTVFLDNFYFSELPVLSVGNISFVPSNLPQYGTITVTGTGFGGQQTVSMLSCTLISPNDGTTCTILQPSVTTTSMTLQFGQYVRPLIYYNVQVSFLGQVTSASFRWTCEFDSI